MHIILTHEQSDFDALASLLGASMLYEDALPVLPQKMNRNVRAFVTLYGVELPFVERQDLPQRNIRLVTLVDTQSMVTVKGVDENTRVQVIDHHPLRSNLPTDWNVTVADTGANTTLFVAALQEHQRMIKPIQATLLLMGIYEDTGSLTYSRTTPRDVRAAAYLLERGASLKIATEFLNHPLSLKQQELYDELRNSAETMEIHGHSIIIACGDARGMDEELSTVAHKLRDLMDPDALVLLVKIRSGVQLIARSTTDHIDVSELALAFGGGGHSRAAAALVKDRSLGEIVAELKQRLNQVVRPAITVAQIMSRGPQLLRPETRLEEVASRMQRFGYEGYPVVAEGRVVGLVTRRAVDRALAHKLNLPASSLMEAGEVTVKPGDSISTLQQLMTDTGWGQIPVVQPESGKVIGIVTRTDLLKILTDNARYTGFMDLSGKLEAALPPERLALLKIIAQAAHEQNCALYIVGGFVRDLLLEHPGQDFDLVVEGDAIALAKWISKRYGGKVTSHSRFGTAKWFLKEKNGQKARLPIPSPEKLPDFVDLISARTEFYTHPTALPTVERGSIKLDLHRRDFTINTLALRLDGHHYGELHDYWGGLNDLRQGLVRALHSISFVDDPTRMLRAVRFEQRFGFKIEERTLQLIKEALELMDRVSGDRIRHELDRILEEPNASQMIARLEELGVLEAIHPGLRSSDQFLHELDRLRDLKVEDFWNLGAGEAGKEKNVNELSLNNVPLKRILGYMLWLIRLPLEEAESIMQRLKMPRDLVDKVRSAQMLYREMPALAEKRNSEVVFRLDEVPPLSLYGVYLALDNEKEKQVVYNYSSRLRQITATISGSDLRAMGLPPGPRYREILDTLRAAWLDQKVKTVDEERALLKELVGNL